LAKKPVGKGTKVAKAKKGADLLEEPPDEADEVDESDGETDGRLAKQEADLLRRKALTPGEWSLNEVDMDDMVFVMKGLVASMQLVTNPRAAVTTEVVPGSAVTYFDGPKVSIVISRLRRAFAEPSLIPPGLQEWALQRRADRAGQFILTMSGVLMMDRQTKTSRSKDKEGGVGADDMGMIGMYEMQLFNPDNHVETAKISEHELPDIGFRQTEDILRFLDTERMSAIGSTSHAGAAKWNDEISKLRAKMLAYRRNLFGATWWNHDRKVSFEAVLLYFFALTWNRAVFAASADPQCFGQAELLTRDIDSRWRVIQDKYLHLDLPAVEQEMVFRVGLHICQIRCDRCHEVGACQFFCKSCNHVDNKPYFAAKGCSSTTKSPYEIYCWKQGQIKVLPRRLGS
jgi:hypothetical protein